ncbi:MAG: hypothetical protein KAS94_02375, partial [Desulfobulbaceae bacterium]|nr:hypothetical protein [Desulfobulbaceae bacterium]
SIGKVNLCSAYYDKAEETRDWMLASPPILQASRSSDFNSNLPRQILVTKRLQIYRLPTPNLNQPKFTMFTDYLQNKGIRSDLSLNT